MENIHGKWEIAPRKDRMWENYLGWFDHVYRRSTDASYCLQVTTTYSRRGRLKKTWLKTVTNDLKALNLNYKNVLNQTEWRRKTFLADPVNQD